MVGQPIVQLSLCLDENTESSSSSRRRLDSGIADCPTKLVLLGRCRKLAERLAGYSSAMERLDLASNFHDLYLQVEHARKECGAACRELHEHRGEHGC